MERFWEILGHAVLDPTLYAGLKGTLGEGPEGMHKLVFVQLGLNMSRWEIAEMSRVVDCIAKKAESSLQDASAKFKDVDKSAANAQVVGLSCIDLTFLDGCARAATSVKLAEVLRGNIEGQDLRGPCFKVEAGQLNLLREAFVGAESYLRNIEKSCWFVPTGSLVPKNPCACGATFEDDYVHSFHGDQATNLLEVVNAVQTVQALLTSNQLAGPSETNQLSSAVNRLATSLGRPEDDPIPL